MADIQSILKPRRGKQTTMNNTKKTTVLQSGEIFVEVPDTGVGKGDSKIKIGDGTTQYGSLPYALGNCAQRQIEFTEDNSANVTAALNNVVTKKPLSTIIAGLKKAISLTNTSVTQLNDDLSKKISDMQQSFQDGVDSIYELLTSLGFTPDGKDLDSIKKAIDTMYTNRYNSGVTAGKASVTNTNYTITLSMAYQAYNGSWGTIGGAGGTKTLTFTIKNGAVSVSGLDASNPGTKTATFATYAGGTGAWTNFWRNSLSIKKG